jgi:adenylate kinase
VLKQVIVITGTPGVGKTSVSERLAIRLGAFHIDLADLAKREKLLSGYDRRRHTLLADTVKLAKRVQQIIKRSEGDVIIDGHYATSVVSKRKVSKVFLLRCHPQQLKQQMEKRGFRGAKLWENLAAEILDVCLCDSISDVGMEKICEIDMTNKTIDETVEEIISILQGGKECMVGLTDWLRKLEEENILDQYLKEF